jgi:hypothetical protein
MTCLECVSGYGARKWVLYPLQSPIMSIPGGPSHLEEKTIDDFARDTSCPPARFSNLTPNQMFAQIGVKQVDMNQLTCAQVHSIGLFIGGIPEDVQEFKSSQNFHVVCRYSQGHVMGLTANLVFFDASMDDFDNAPNDAWLEFFSMFSFW